MNNKLFNLKNYFIKIKETKMFIPIAIIGGLILVFLIILLLTSNTDITSNITEIETDLPEKIYVDENTSFNTEVFGTGNLQNTAYTYKIGTTGIIYLSNQTLMGSKVTNQIMGLKTGEVTITINARLGTKKLSINQRKVAVCNKLSAEILTTEEIDIVIGKTNQFKIDLGKPSICSDGLTYKIDNPNIATVDSNGKLTGVKHGTTVLILEQDNLTLKVPVNVLNEEEKVTGIKLNSYSYVINSGESYKINAIIIPTTAVNKDVVWVSSNSNIVQVNQSGVVTGISQGTAKVVVKTKSGGYYTTATITVK